MKEYIRDNGKIRNCDSNIAKMNMFEYWWFDIIHNKSLKYAIFDTFELYGECFKNLGTALFNTICIILFPITFMIKAYNSIKFAKKEVEKHKRIREGMKL